jgi:hypothetical protein
MVQKKYFSPEAKLFAKKQSALQTYYRRKEREQHIPNKKKIVKAALTNSDTLDKLYAYLLTIVPVVPVPVIPVEPVPVIPAVPVPISGLMRIV